MGLLKRLGDSLFNPSEVLQYRVDKKIVTFCYFMLLCLLLMIPNFIKFFTDTTFFTYEVKTNIRYDFFNQNEIPYEIENGKLKFTGENEKTQYALDLETYNLTIVFTSQDKIIETDDMHQTIIVCGRDKVSIKASFSSFDIFSYSDYPVMEGIDFKKITTSDRVFWDQLFDTFSEVEKTYHSFYVLFSVITIILKSLGSLLLFLLFITLINRISAQNIYSFGDHLKLMIYYVTPFAFGVVFATLFDIVLLEYIGLIITFVYSLRINQINYTGGNDNEL